MKLNTTQITAIRNQIGAEPVEEANPANEQLREVFGDHTFYADKSGLFVMEPAEEAQSAEQVSSVQIVQIGTWANEQQDALKPIEPRAFDRVIEIGADAGTDTTA